MSIYLARIPKLLAAPDPETSQPAVLSKPHCSTGIRTLEGPGDGGARL